MLYSDKARKERVERLATSAFKGVTDGVLPSVCIGTFVDRAWIMSFATDDPWIPINSDTAKAVAEMATLLSPSNGPRLMSANSILFATNASINLPIIGTRYVKGIVEKTPTGDNRYVRAAVATALYLRNKVLQFDLSYMWASQKARIRFDMLDDAIQGTDPASIAKLGLVRPIEPLTSRFDVWETAYTACVTAMQAGTKMQLDSKLFTKLQNATEHLRVATIQSLLILSFAAITSESGVKLSVIRADSFRPRIHLKREILGELERVYPQTFVLSDSGVLVDAPLYALDNFIVQGTMGPDGTIPLPLMRKLTVGIVAQPTWLTYWFDTPGLKCALPTLFAIAMASPNHAGFFLSDPKSVAAIAAYTCKDCQLNAPYSTANGLLSRQEAAKLGRLTQRRSNSQIVYPINPSAPYSIVADAATEGVAIPKELTVEPFFKSRLLLPSDFTDGSTSLDAALAAAIRKAIPNFLTGVALDFLVHIGDNAQFTSTDGFRPILFTASGSAKAARMPGYYYRAEVAEKGSAGRICRLTYLFTPQQNSKGGEKRK